MAVTLTAGDIMHPRLSIPARERVPEIVKRLTCPYPALPVVNDQGQVLGILSEDEILHLIIEERDTYGVLAQAIMICGHPEHSHCGTPVSVPRETPIEEVVARLYRLKSPILPVVENRKLVGIIGRKQIVNVMAETGLWPGHEHLRMKKGYLGGIVGG